MPALRELRRVAECVSFDGTRNRTSSVERLMYICGKEGIPVSKSALAQMFDNCNNDMRYCLNTLQVQSYLLQFSICKKHLLLVMMPPYLILSVVICSDRDMTN